MTGSVTLDREDVLRAADRIVLDEHEFDLVCDMTTDGKPCNEVAVWIVVHREHECIPPKILTALFCARHHQWMMHRGEAQHVRCGVVCTFLDYVISIEPLRPSTGDHQ